MFKFIHCADVHLDSPTVGLEQHEAGVERRTTEATRRAFEKMVSLALREQVAFVLIAGDLFDGELHSMRTGLFFCEQMVRLANAGIDVVAIAGNHDAVGRMTTTLSLPSNVRFLSGDAPETCVLEKVGVAVHGQSFPRQVVKESLVGSGRYPRRREDHFNIGLLHTAMEHAGVHASYAPCTIGDLRSYGYDYWALGHIHKREIVCEAPLVIYPGNLQGRDVGEPGAKGCYVVRVVDGHADPVFHAVDVVRWETCDVSAPDARDGEEVMQAICDALEAVAGPHGGLPVAVRVHLETNAIAAHALRASPERAMDTVREAVLARGHSHILLERLKIRVTADATAAHSQPVQELLALMEELRAEPTELAALSEVLEPLRVKVAAEVGELKTFKPRDEAWLRDVLTETRSYLSARMRDEEAE